MNILIKGLEISEDGYLDVRILSQGGLNSVTWNDLGCCPYAEAHDVVVLPEKHGRLVDADALIAKYGDWYTEEGKEEGFIGTIEALLKDVPTVVEAEDGE